MSTDEKEKASAAKRPAGADRVEKRGEEELGEIEREVAG